MSRRSARNNGRSRRPRSVRRRVLRIDRLEGRRLFHSSFGDDSLEHSFPDEEWEGDEQFETDSEHDLRLAAGPSRVEIARFGDTKSEDAEGEDDDWEDSDWEDETEDLESLVPTPPTGWTQDAAGESGESESQEPVSPGQLVPNSDSLPQGDDLAETEEPEHLAASPTGTAVSFVSIVVRYVKVSPERDDSTVAEVAAGDEETAASGGEEASVTEASGENENVAAVPVQTQDRIEAEADAKSLEADSPRPAEVKASPPPAETGTRERVAGQDVDVPRLELVEVPRQAMPPVEQQSGSEWRSAGIPPADRRSGHASTLAASFPGFLGVDAWRLRDTVPQDLTALETALRDLLADSCEVGWDVVDWLLSPDVLQGILAGTIAVLAAEIVRQKLQQARADATPPEDRLDCSLGLFPEFVGLPLGRI